MENLNKQILTFSVTDLILIVVGGMLLGGCVLGTLLAFDLADNRSYFSQKDCRPEKGLIESNHAYKFTYRVWGPKSNGYEHNLVLR